MSESLRNDGRIWVPKKLEDVKALREGTLKQLAAQYSLSLYWAASKVWMWNCESVTGIPEKESLL